MDDDEDPVYWSARTGVQLMLRGTKWMEELKTGDAV